ncbi:MAG: amidohydrolase family protein [Candidatus Zixiibacteriota bacterium]
MKKQSIIISGTVLALFANLFMTVCAFAHDYTPAAPQSFPVLLRGGTLHTASHGELASTDLLFVDGIITAIGQNLTIPAKTEVIDVTGMHVYPGLIAPSTTLGLIEIGLVRATNDQDEVGSINPEVKAHIAYNPDSEILPTVRSNGITTALIVPQGDLIAGQSTLLNLDGWTWEDSQEKLSAAMHISWPNAGISAGFFGFAQPAEEQLKAQKAQEQAIYSILESAESYRLAKKANPSGTPVDLRLESLQPLLEGSMPAIVAANDKRQMERAMAFAERFKLRLIFMGGYDALDIADQLKARNIGIITQKVHSLPNRSEDDYDFPFRLPGLLAGVGLKVAICDGLGSWNVRNLPFQAGQAVAFGMSKEDALRSITLWPAEMLGVAEKLGSLDIGKKATIVVSKGDIMDYTTHRVVYEFIGGRLINLENKQTELNRKYKNR